jgi:drug/metabolite transporter (DMT)-like permease
VAVRASSLSISPPPAERRHLDNDKIAGPAPAGWPAWVLMLSSVVGFAIMNGCAKEAARALPFWQVAAARALGGALVALLVAKVSRASIRVRSRGIMVARTITGALALSCTFYALAHVPLGEATALFNLSPLLVAALAPTLLDERFEPWLGVLLLVGLAGVFLVAKPPDALMLFADPAAFWASLHHGHLIALTSAVFAAMSMISLRKLGRTENAEAVVFWFQSVTALLLITFTGRTFQRPTLIQAGLLAGAAIAGSLGQLAMTRAYAKERAARIGVLSYLQIPVGVLMGGLFFGERPTPTVLAGITLILVAGASVVVVSQRGSPVTTSANKLS